MWIPGKKRETWLSLLSEMNKKSPHYGDFLFH